MVCPRCDFDPYLYAKDIPGARVKVEIKLKAAYAKRQAEKTI
jgi:hypothetical protein